MALWDQHYVLMQQFFSMPFGFLFYLLAKYGYLSLRNRYVWLCIRSHIESKYLRLPVLPTGICMCALEDVSWRSSQWECTVHCCLPLSSASFCFFALWTYTTFIAGCLECRWHGKHFGTSSSSTENTTCTGMSTWGTSICKNLINKISDLAKHWYKHRKCNFLMYVTDWHMIMMMSIIIHQMSFQSLLCIWISQ